MDFQTYSDSAFVLESPSSSFVAICRWPYKRNQIHTETS